MTVVIFRLSFSVFAHAFPTEISSIFGKSFSYFFPYFVKILIMYDFHLPVHGDVDKNIFNVHL